VTVPARPNDGFFSTLRHFGWLLWPLWRGTANAGRARHGRTRARVAVFGVLGFCFMWAAWSGSTWLFEAFLQAEFLAEALIRRTVAVVLVFFSGLLVFSSTVTSFSTFFAADDLPLLVAAPVPTGRLYLARLVETWVQSSWMMLVFALPMMAAVGPVLAAPPSYYVSLPLLLVPLTLTCSVGGTVVALLLARLFPAQRLQEALVVLALLGFVGVYVAFRMTSPEKFMDPEGFGDLMGLIAGLRDTGPPLGPSEWTVAVMFGLLRHEPLEALLPATTLVLAAPAACMVGVWVARGVWLRGYQLGQEGRRRGGLVRGRTGRPIRPARSPVAALVRRDIRLFFRTTSQWTQLLLIAVLVSVYIFNFKHFGVLQQSGVLGSTGLFFANIALGGLVLTTVAVRFLYPAVSLEGRAFWAIQAAPITAGELLASKVRFGFWPLLGLGVALVLAGSALVELPGVLVVASVGLMGLITWALTGLGVGLGALAPRFDLDNPARIASGMGGVVFMLLGLGYLVAVSLLLAWPVRMLRTGVDHGDWPTGSRLAWALGLTVAALALTWLCHHVPLRLGRRALERGEA
jgi:ABC-2 type transport system permease protein